MYYELTDHFQVGAGIERCWDFFSRAENLPLITPPWLGFTLAMPPPLPTIGQDSVLDYTIRWFGMAVKWRTRIIDFTPPRQFIDLQTRGPYALWHHQHTFSAGENDDGVICSDTVVYRLPLGPIGRLTDAIVRRQLIEIFTFRRRVIGEHLGGIQALQVAPTVRALR